MIGAIDGDRKHANRSQPFDFLCWLYRDQIASWGRQ